MRQPSSLQVSPPTCDINPQVTQLYSAGRARTMFYHNTVHSCRRRSYSHTWAAAAAGCAIRGSTCGYRHQTWRCCFLGGRQHGGCCDHCCSANFSYMHVKRRRASTCTRLAHLLHLSLFSCIGQAEFVVAFLGITWARAVAAPLNQNYKQVRIHAMPHLLTLLLSDHHRQVECIEGIHAVALQDEFVFYLEDANSKLLVVPASGNAAAEAAAQDKCVPVATFRLPSGKLLDFNMHGRSLCWAGASTTFATCCNYGGCN